MGDLEFDLGVHGRLLIEEGVLEHMLSFSQMRFWQRESGGQLFAEISDKSWRIKRATGPRRSDVRFRFGFRPNRAAERKEILTNFSAGLHYVGDWHTHPQDSPAPSKVDLESMTDIVSKSEHELPGFLMLIVGRAAPPDGIWTSLHFANGGYQQLSLSN